jgi:uncharacterized protein YukE
MYKYIITIIMLKISLFGFYFSSSDFPIDASSCSSSANQLKNYADDLETQEENVNNAKDALENAKSDYKMNCGSGGLYSNDEMMCRDYGTYKTTYKNAVDDYNDAIDNYNRSFSDVKDQLKAVLNNCQ